MNLAVTLNSGERPGFKNLTDVLIHQGGTELLLWFEDPDQSVYRFQGIRFGFCIEDPTECELRDFTEPTGEFLQLEIYDQYWHVPGRCSSITYIIRTTTGEYPITLYQHDSDNNYTVSLWQEEMYDENWESIL